MFRLFNRKKKVDVTTALDPLLAGKVKAVQLLEMKPGEVLVVQVHEDFPTEHLYLFHQQLKGILPNNPVVVVDNRFDFMKFTHSDFNTMKMSGYGNG